MRDHDQASFIRRATSRRLLTQAWVAILLLGHAPALFAGPLDGTGAKAVVKFEPLSTPPPLLAGRLQGSATALHVAMAPQGALYAVTDDAGKARVWLVSNGAVAADITAPASRPRMIADWTASFAFWLGGMPVVAVSWKFSGLDYGIEDLAFWAAEGNGRFLGGLPGSTRSACAANEGAAAKDCARCASAAGIPVDLRIASIENDRARFVQQRAATWYYYFSAAADVFEQDYVLTAKGLAPDGAARGNHRSLPPDQAKDRVKALLRDYFRLAKSQNRQAIAPEFLICFQQAAELAPDFGQAHYNVACMHALLGNRKEAIEALRKALTLSPQYRKLARKDPDLESVRDDPEIARLLGEAEK